MAPVVKLVDKASDATLLFNFNEPAGTGNPNSLKTVIMGDPDFGRIPFDPGLFEPEDSPGGSLIKNRHGLVQMSFKFRPEATTSDNLFAGIGKLGQYLNNPSEYALFIQLDGWAEKRYADIVIGAIPALLRGRERGLFEVSTLLKDPQGIEVLLWRQPYLRGPSVTVGPTTVQNDPADASGRFIEVTNAGNAPAPAAVKVQGDSGAKVQEIVIARKSAFPYANTRVTDYTGGTQFGQLNASGNGWTVTLATGTTSVADVGNASGDNAAQTSYSTNPTVMAKRVRITRTTNLDSLRGTFNVYVRCRSMNAARHIIQLRWAHSLADPATFSNPEAAPVETTGDLTYFDHPVGRISIPQGHMLGGIALELWSRRETGTGSFNWDFISLVPADESLSTIVVPGGATQMWTGSQLVTPVANPAGGTAGVVSGTGLLLDTTTDNAGTPPNTGFQLAGGVHRVSFSLRWGDSGSTTVLVGVRNISDSTYVASTTVTLQGYAVTTATVEAEIGVGSHSTSDLYQFQIDNPAAALVDVYSVTHTFIPYIASGEEAHADPEKQMLHKMDSADTIVAPLAVDGPLPAWLAPGLNTFYIHYGDIKLESAAPGPQSVLSRDCAVTISYSPRYLT